MMTREEENKQAEILGMDLSDSKGDKTAVYKHPSDSVVVQDATPIGLTDEEAASVLAGSLVSDPATKAALTEALTERLGEDDEESKKMKQVVVASTPAPSAEAIANIVPFKTAEALPASNTPIGMPNVPSAESLVAGMTNDDKIAARVMGEMEERLKDLTTDKIDELSDEEVNEILGNEMISATAALMKDSEEHTPEEFRRDFLKFMVAQNDMDKIIEEQKRVLATEMEQFKSELSNLVNNLDTQEEIVKIDEMLETETDEEKIKKLHDLRGVLMSSLHLSNLSARIENLGGKAAVLKRTKKNFDKEQKNFLRYVRNNSKMFLDPTYVETDLRKIVPLRFKDQVKPLLYLFYREVTKDKNISVQTASFVNYFLINITKSLVNDEEKDANVASFKQSLIDVLTLLK